MIIFKVQTAIGFKPNKRRDNTIAKLNTKLASINAEVEEYKSSSDPITVKCHNCNQVWSESYGRITSGRAACTSCHPELAIRKRNKEPRVVLTPEEKQQQRISRYANKVLERSNNTLDVDKSSYTGSKEPVTATCSICGHEWTTRADHLLSRYYCPKCKSN